MLKEKDHDINNELVDITSEHAMEDLTIEVTRDEQGGTHIVYDSPGESGDRVIDSSGNITGHSSSQAEKPS